MGIGILRVLWAVDLTSIYLGSPVMMFIEFQPMILANAHVIVFRVHWSARSSIPIRLSIEVGKSICDVGAKEHKLALSTRKDALPGSRRLRQVGTKAP